MPKWLMISLALMLALGVIVGAAMIPVLLTSEVDPWSTAKYRSPTPERGCDPEVWRSSSDYVIGESLVTAHFLGITNQAFEVSGPFALSIMVWLPEYLESTTTMDRVVVRAGTQVLWESSGDGGRGLELEKIDFCPEPHPMGSMIGIGWLSGHEDVFDPKLYPTLDVEVTLSFGASQSVQSGTVTLPFVIEEKKGVLRPGG